MSDFNYRGKLPFLIISSSVDTGYNAELTAAVGHNIEVVNQHRDEYGALQDAPLQGPFTEQWIGGNQHRHIPLNEPKFTEELVETTTSAVSASYTYAVGDEGEIPVLTFTSLLPGVNGNNIFVTVEYPFPGETIDVSFGEEGQIYVVIKIEGDGDSGFFPADLESYVNNSANWPSSEQLFTVQHFQNFMIGYGNIFEQQLTGGSDGDTILVPQLVAKLDDPTNRPEAFLISGSTNKVRVYGPTHFDILAPKALLTRDTVSKSPVSIKNIRNQGRRLGNFTHNYQIVQTSGRDINESLIENNLTASGVLTTKFIKFLESPTVAATALKPDQLLFTAIIIDGNSGNSRRIRLLYGQPATNITESGDDITINSILLGTSSGTRLTTAQVAEIINDPLNWVSGVPKCTAENIYFGDGVSRVFTFAFINFTGGVDGTLGPDKYNLPEEPNKTKSVFVERFSAPGDWKESSRGALDRESEQYSPNNSLVTRNISVRKRQNALLTQHMPQFGSGSTFFLTPIMRFDPTLVTTKAVSYHKVNRNSILKTAEETSCAILTEIPSIIFTETDGYLQVEQCDEETALIGNSFHDNFWVQHPIPATDLRYRWIKDSTLTASVAPIPASVTVGQITFTAIPVGNDSGNSLRIRFLKNQPTDSITVSGKDITISLTSPTVFVNSLAFYVNNAANWTGPQLCTAYTDEENEISDFGFANFSGGTDGYTQGIITRYQSPYKSSELLFNSASLVVSGTNKQFQIDHAGINSIVKDKKEISLTTNTFTVFEPSVSSSFSEITNTPFGFSTWRQIRAGEHPVSRKLVQANIISIEGLKNNLKHSTYVKNYIQAPVTNRFKPLKEVLELKNSDQKQKFVFSHINNFSTFANHQLVDDLGINEDSQQLYDVFRKYYIDPNRANDDQNPVVNLESLTYAETIYPKELNSYLSGTRGRTSYILDKAGETRDGFDIQLGKQRVFWRDSLEDRQRSDLASGFLNSMGYRINKRNFSVTKQGKFKFVNDDSTAAGEYTSSQEYKNKIYLDSVHSFDNNLNNNENRFIADTIVFISASDSENGIFTKHLDNGNSAELNGEIFLDYTYSDISRPIPPIASTAHLPGKKGLTAAKTLSVPNFVIVETDDPPSNIVITEILPTLVDTPIPVAISINYSAPVSAIYAEGGDPVTWNIDITGSTILTTLEFINYVNDLANWKVDPTMGVGAVSPVFGAALVSPSGTTSSLVNWSGNQNTDGGVAATDVILLEDINVLDFTFIPVGDDSGNGWTITIQNGPTDIITESGQDIFINLTASFNIVPSTDSYYIFQLISFVNNPANWQSGVPKFTLSSDYASYYLPITNAFGTFEGGVDGIPATPRQKLQLTRVTDHSVLTQFDERIYIPPLLGGLVPEKLNSYASLSNLFIDQPPFSTKFFFNIPTPRPKYLAFLGGFESGSRDYSIDTEGEGENDLDNYHFFTTQPTNTIRSTLDSGLRYSVEEMSGKKPWFDSYEDYSSDIRFIGQDHSVIPEFKISSFMPYYIKEKGGNFYSKNRAFLEIDGADIVNWHSALANSSPRYQKEFINNYVTTEPLKNITNLQNENSAVTKLEEISFTISGIKKLLPYNGFYPQERTIQLANLFNDYMNDNVGGGYFKFTKANGLFEALVEIEQQSDKFAKGAVMPYFFAPGILYNTIKSGISVDFPAITASFEQTYNVRDSENTEDSMSVFEEIPIPLISGGLPCVTASIISQGFLNSRFPFESIIFPNLAIPYNNKITASVFPVTGNVALMEEIFENTVEGTLFNIKTDAHANPDKFYIDGLAIGRGWKRTIPFAYLKNTKITDPSYSLAMSNFLAEIPRFFLENGQMNVFRSSEVKNWKNFNQDKKYFLDLKMRKSSDLVMIQSYTSNAHVSGDSIEKTMNGRYFGWPVNKTTASVEQKIENAENNMHLLHNDPAYAPFTPPYFEGEAILRLTLQPSKDVYSNVKELFQDITITDIFDSLGRAIDTGSDAYKFKMSIEDCLTIFGVGKNKEVSYDTAGKANTVSDTLDLGREYWAISPKLETPVLDFSSQTLTAHTGTYWLADGYGRGMWSGYGTVPTGSKGIVLELAESFPLQRDLRYGRFDEKLTGSLLDQVGLKPEIKKIGKIAQNKEISEAIVLIPFVDNPIPETTIYVDGHHFFAINKDIFNIQNSNLNIGAPAIKAGDLGSDKEITETSISKTIKAMKKYVIPPNFNYSNFSDKNQTVQPFVMYIFEFNEILDQQDLSDIWQGVLPKIGTTAKKQDVTFKHKIGKYEMFGENFSMPENVRWMVFKVKRKAEWNYFAITEDQSDDSRFRFNFANSQTAQTPDYSYNWPYDYFSLVELAKVDLALKYEEKPQITGSLTDSFRNNQFTPNFSDIRDIENTFVINKRKTKRKSGFVKKEKTASKKK